MLIPKEKVATNTPWILHPKNIASIVFANVPVWKTGQAESIVSFRDLDNTSF